ncbi:MAG: gliding motility protein [Polyangiaceae bacterium]
MKLELPLREVSLKFVYYGPGLSGKTTNLRALHERMSEASRGQLLTLDTADERTLFFDMFPLSFRVAESHFHVKIYTVPGQAIHASTRSMVVSGVDGLVFVADSRRAAIVSNAQSFEEMRAHLRAQDLDPRELPLVIQFNKRDLNNIRPDEELERLARRGRDWVFPAVANRGEGVVETFLAAMRMTWRSLDERYQLEPRLGVTEEQLLQAVAEQLGVTEPVARLLASRFGVAA